MGKAKRDFINSIILLVLSGLFYWGALLLPPPILGKTGPGFFPKIVIPVLIFLSFSLLIQSVIRMKKESGGSSSRFSFNEWIITNRKVILTFVIFAIYIVLFSIIGFVFSTILFLLGIYFLLANKRQGIWKIGIGFIVLTLILYFVFKDILFVFLPSGIW